MGWGRYLLLGSLGQQLDLSDQRAEIDQLRNELRTARVAGPAGPGPIRQLQQENDELRLYIAALVRILVNKRVVTAEELREVVEAIDAEDGTPDGRYEGRLS